MNSVADILKSVKQGRISVDEAEKMLRLDAVTILGDLARIDSSRFLRRGVPEIVYAAGKSESQLSTIVTGLLHVKNRASKGRRTFKDSTGIIFSRIKGPGQIRSIVEATNIFNERNKAKFAAEHYQGANMIIVSNGPLATRQSGRVALLSAGTSDIPALNEAEVILSSMGCKTLRFNDVGVAALHRLEDPMKKIVAFDPDAIVVAAGMEGALPSVVAGLSSVPVIGLPTSIGYGLGGSGEAALMSMLQACPLGMSVVNIDAGVAAGIVAYLIANRAQGNRSKKLN